MFASTESHSIQYALDSIFLLDQLFPNRTRGAQGHFNCGRNLAGQYQTWILTNYFQRDGVWKGTHSIRVCPCDSRQPYRSSEDQGKQECANVGGKPVHNVFKMWCGTMFRTRIYLSFR